MILGPLTSMKYPKIPPAPLECKPAEFDRYEFCFEGRKEPLVKRWPLPFQHSISKVYRFH